MEPLNYEHKQLSRMINTIAEIANIPPDVLGDIRNKAKVTTQGIVNSTKTSPTVKKEKLLDEKNTNPPFYFNEGEPKYKEFNATRAAMLEHIMSMMMRQENILEYQRNYANIDPNIEKADKAARKAYRKWRANEGPIGWRNKIDIEAKVGEGATYDFNYNPSETSFTAIIYVDETYMDTVEANNINVVDIAGKPVITLKAEEIIGHELEDNNVRLFKATVGYTKVSRGINTYRLKCEEEARSLIRIEEKWIAFQELPNGRITATGKDKAWAIRTMKSRMKLTMMKQMGLK